MYFIVISFRTGRSLLFYSKASRSSTALFEWIRICENRWCVAFWQGFNCICHYGVKSRYLISLLNANVLFSSAKYFSEPCIYWQILQKPHLQKWAALKMTIFLFATRITEAKKKQYWRIIFIILLPLPRLLIIFVRTFRNILSFSVSESFKRIIWTLKMFFKITLDANNWLFLYFIISSLI